jgi:hypothetical protein
METNVEQPKDDKFNLELFLAARKELRIGVDETFAKLVETKKFDRKDILKAIRELRKQVQACDDLSDIVINDLMIIDNRFQQLEQRTLAVAQGHTVLRQSLEDNNIITKDQMQKTWEEKIKPMLDEKVKEAQSALVTPPSGLVDSAGIPIS